MLNRQEIFDRAATHLLAQMKKSYRGGNERGCAYRSPTGMKCAIGALIPDDRYHPEMEGIEASGIDILRAIDADMSDPNIGNFVNSLQSVHDRNMPLNWRAELAEFAGIYNLDASVLS